MKATTVIVLMTLRIMLSPAAAQDSLVMLPERTVGVVIQDPRVTDLIDLHREVNRKINGMEGYRLQIFFDSGTDSKSRALEAASTFQQMFPEVSVYLSFQSPNYKVRVGDFRTRLDAIWFLQSIMIDYPNAFIISDRINLPKVE